MFLLLISYGNEVVHGTLAFDWCQNFWTALNGYYELYYTNYASFGAHDEKMNEDRLTLSAAKCSIGSDFITFSVIGLVSIFAEALWTEGVERHWVSMKQYCATAVSQ